MSKNEYLYYPYSRCIDDTHLKKSLLLFDKVVFLDTQPQFMRNALMYQENKEYAEKIEETYNYLSDMDAIKVINPQPIINKYDLFLTMNVTCDLRDKNYCDLAIKHSTDVWSILYERLPPSFIKAFYPGAGTFWEAISIQNLLRTYDKLSLLSDHENHLIANDFMMGQFSNLTNSELWEIFDNRYKYVIGGNPHITLETYEVPFLQASSLRINEALLVCYENGYVPFTDSAIHSKLLNAKLDNTLAKINADKNIRDSVVPDLQYVLPKEHLSLKIIDELLPSECLRDLSFSELISYKSENIKLLDRFNAKIAEISACVEEVGHDDNYYRNLQRIIDKEVIPEIKEIKGELNKSFEKNFGKLILNSIGVLVPTISASILGGLSFINILTACAIAEIGYLTTAGSDKLMDIVSSTRQRKRTDYSYLLNLLP